MVSLFAFPFSDDKIERKSFIIEDLKNTKIQESAYEDAVTKVNLGTFFDLEDYVFMLGFNINEYPKVKRDTDYLSDEIKDALGLDTSMDYNHYQSTILLESIHHIKNLVITYKLRSSSGVFYPSVLVKELGVEVKPVFLLNTVSYSRLYSEIKYAEALDDLYKFNIVHDNLGIFQNSIEIPYQEYDNQFTGISKNLILNKIEKPFVLSYTNLEMYQECAFRYYISKILHLDIFLENFKTIVGSIMHHILAY